MRWLSTASIKPRPGSLVLVKTRRATCTCSGYDDRVVYYDEKGVFQGIKNQKWVDKWLYSEMNDTLTDEAKRLIKPEPCKNCVV